MQKKSGKSLIRFLNIDSQKHHLIAVVGAGGKTSLIYHLAKELRAFGLNPVVTTTTHIQSEGRFGFRPVGRPCAEGKLKTPDKETFLNLLKKFDVVLVEADGSRQHPMKVPADHEPVIPDGTDLVIGVAGSDAIGRTFREGCHRYELACELLSVHPEDRITKSHLETVLASEKGQRKNVACDYRTFINYGDLFIDQDI